MNDTKDVQKYMLMTIDDLYEEIQSTKRQLSALQKLYDVRQQFGERTQKQINAATRKKNSSKGQASKTASPTDEFLQPNLKDTTVSDSVVRGAPSAGGHPQENTGG